MKDGEIRIALSPLRRHSPLVNSELERLRKVAESHTKEEIWAVPGIGRKSIRWLEEMAEELGWGIYKTKRSKCKLCASTPWLISTEMEVVRRKLRGESFRSMFSSCGVSEKTARRLYAGIKKRIASERGIAEPEVTPFDLAGAVSHQAFLEQKESQRHRREEFDQWRADQSRRREEYYRNRFRMLQMRFGEYQKMIEGRGSDE